MEVFTIHDDEHCYGAFPSRDVAIQSLRETFSRVEIQVLSELHTVADCYREGDGSAYVSINISRTHFSQDAKKLM